LFDLLETAKQIRKYSDIEFYLAGKGELEDKLKNRIKKDNLYNVKLLGSFKHEELLKIYQKATLFIFPSYYEGFPTVVLEAMSCGLPVLVTDIEAHKTFIEDGKNGIFIKKGSAEDATKKIELILNNSDLRDKLGKNARKTIEEKFTWDKISLKFEKIYNLTIS
jgi:glycosyltransferase involved in cell wall biosynthesis